MRSTNTLLSHLKPYTLLGPSLLGFSVTRSMQLRELGFLVIADPKADPKLLTETFSVHSPTLVSVNQTPLCSIWMLPSHIRRVQLLVVLQWVVFQKKPPSGGTNFPWDPEDAVLVIRAVHKFSSSSPSKHVSRVGFS